MRYFEQKITKKSDLLDTVLYSQRVGLGDKLGQFYREFFDNF